jgi:hypothetical protein
MNVKKMLVALYVQQGSKVCEFCQEASYISYSFVLVTVTDVKITLYVTGRLPKTRLFFIIILKVHWPLYRRPVELLNCSNEQRSHRLRILERRGR